jgi:hypothetical protein
MRIVVGRGAAAVVPQLRVLLVKREWGVVMQITPVALVALLVVPEEQAQQVQQVRVDQLVPGVRLAQQGQWEHKATA